MKLAEVILLYLGFGVACAVALHRRAPAYDRAARLTALLTIPLWPLLAPIAWTARRERPSTPPSAPEERIRAALDEVTSSVHGTPLARLIDGESARALLEEVERLASRRHELLALLERDSFDPVLAQQKLDELRASGASPRAQSSALLHLSNIRRLSELAERDSHALEELAELTSALRTQLVLVRLSGSGAAGVSDTLGELWARLEALSEASDEVYGDEPSRAHQEAAI
ncbi:MAG: hypothetical protein KIT72_04910 [Polyangiaceae bacterium]|nr:hypothetical protein [Polyangiaceae bacterium]MCW5789744.1 hypothetical protein [Polyangiaceae bacterium]